MKKLFAIILSMVLCFFLCACDGIGKATITFADNSTEKISLNKLIAQYEKDHSSFYEKYPEGTVITFRDKIDSFINNKTFTVESGISVEFKSGTVDSISSWNDKDDIVEITAEIIEGYRINLEVSLNTITLII